MTPFASLRVLAGSCAMPVPPLAAGPIGPTTQPASRLPNAQSTFEPRVNLERRF